METRAAPPIEPWRRLGTESYRRRYELFFLAAPVFERRGYRGATVRALAQACYLSPAGLYHWFASKADLATYPLRAPRVSWETTYVDPAVDPLAQLGGMVDLAVQHVRLYLLAIRLQEEITGSRDDRSVAAAFRQGEAVFARLAHETAPTLEREEAVILGRDLMALLVGSAIAGLDPEPNVAPRTRLIGVIRDRLVPKHVDPGTFDRAMSRPRT